MTELSHIFLHVVLTIIDQLVLSNRNTIDSPNKFACELIKLSFVKSELEEARLELEFGFIFE